MQEGRNGYDEVISKLKKTEPMKSLEWSNALGNACWDLVLDIGPAGTEGPLGTWKDSKLDWVKAHSKSFGLVEQTIMFPSSPTGSGEGVEMVKSILIDDGIKGWVH